jgi:hypothetical protein
MIQPVESLKIIVLVDNSTDSLSTNPGFGGRKAICAVGTRGRRGRPVAALPATSLTPAATR